MVAQLPSSVLEWALYYHSRGWYPVHIRPGTKKPFDNNWPRVLLSEREIPEVFVGPCNVGVILGESSGWLVDVDLDCEASVRLAARFLPATGARFGRPGKPLSHWLYEAPGAKTERLTPGKDVQDGALKDVTIVELRSTGGQTVFPGSVWTSKDGETTEPITWDGDGRAPSPAQVTYDVLRLAVARLAAASLLVMDGWDDDSACHAAVDASLLTDLGGPSGDRVRKFLGIASAATAKKGASQPPRGDCTPRSYKEAVEAYNAAHGRDWGTPGANACPMCGYHRGFGRMRSGDSGKWACFAAVHDVPGFRDPSGTCVIGDALDLDAHAAGKTPVEHLRETGYLRPKRERRPEPPMPEEPEVQAQPQPQAEEKKAKKGKKPQEQPPEPPGEPVYLEEPLERDSDPCIAHVLCSDLRGDSPAPLVYDEGELYRYSPEAKTWEMVDEDDAWRLLDSYDGRPFVCGRTKGGDPKIDTLRLRTSRFRGIFRLVCSLSRQIGFFRRAPVGVNFRNVFVRVTSAGVSSEERTEEHRCRKTLPIDYDLSAKGDRWERFIGEVLANDPCAFETARTLQQFVGACLLGLAPRYQQALVLTGAGANGKSVFLDVIKQLVPPELRCAVPPQDFNKDFRLSALVGKLLNVVSEMPDTDVEGSGKFKAVVTGDEITADRKNRDPVTFAPVAAQVFACNALASTPDATEGYWRRWLVVKFSRKFLPHERDRGLTDFLVENELPAVAIWAIGGAIDLLTTGAYSVSETSRKALEDWRVMSNPVQRWLMERTLPPEDGRDGLGGRVLYRDYASWCGEVGHKAMSEVKFVEGIKLLGYEQHKGAKGARTYPLVLIGRSAYERQATWS